MKVVDNLIELLGCASLDYNAGPSFRIDSGGRPGEPLGRGFWGLARDKISDTVGEVLKSGGKHIIYIFIFIFFCVKERASSLHLESKRK